MQPEPRWDVPSNYGFAAAVESMGLVSAPLLTGFSITLAVFVIQSEGVFHWASAALFLLVGAALAFIASVQFTFRARQYAVTPPEMEMWWSDPAEPERRQMLRREQRYYRREHGRWARLARAAYDVAIVGFLLGVTLLFVPPGGVSAASGGRVAVLILAMVGLVAEVAWIARTRLLEPPSAEWPDAGPEIGT